MRKLRAWYAVDLRRREGAPYFAEVRPDIDYAERHDAGYGRRQGQNDRMDQPSHERVYARLPEIMLDKRDPLNKVNEGVKDRQVPSGELHGLVRDQDEDKGDDQSPDPDIGRVPMSEGGHGNRRC